MSESPSGLFPDFWVGWDATPAVDHLTEISVARSGREQRRGVFSAAGYRRWSFSSNALTQANRKTLRDFFNTQRGRLGAFYFWNPFPETLASVACGTVTASATFTVPTIKGQWYGLETQSTPVAATYTSVTVGGVSKAVTTTPNIGASGQDQLTFSAGAQTGAVVVTATNARELLVCRFDVDSLVARLMQDASDVRSIFRVAVKEVF